jgi:pyroglutamyl-peptidase
MAEIRETRMESGIVRNPVLLVTGFGPFDVFTENPSGDIAEAADGRMVAGVSIIGRRLEVRWRAAWEALRLAVEQYRPDGLLCLGVAADPVIRLEIRAMNSARPCADVTGEMPPLFDSGCIVQGAPPSYETTLPVDWLKERFQHRRERGSPREDQGVLLPAVRSTDPGRYLCNYVFFHAMHFFAGQAPWRGFVHVPPYPSGSIPGGVPREEVRAAGEFLVEELAQWLENAAAAGSTICPKDAPDRPAAR